MANISNNLIPLMESTLVTNQGTNQLRMLISVYDAISHK